MLTAALLKQELLSGRLHVAGAPLSSSLAEVRAGTLRALAITASKRIAVLPNVPTVREIGYPALEAEGRNGVFAPAKKPRLSLNSSREIVAHSAALAEMMGIARPSRRAPSQSSMRAAASYT